MSNPLQFKILLPQVKHSMHALQRAVPFAYKNKLWKGFFEHRWMVVLSLFVSFIFTFFLFQEISESFFTNSKEMSALSAMDMANVEDNLKDGGKDSFFSGGIKYLLIILLEVIIFYFSVKTLSRLKGKEIVFSFKDFIRAEKRMIKVMLINYGIALLFHLALLIVLSIAGLKVLKPILIFLVYAYFIGYAFMDNYFEQKGMSIKASRALIWEHLGAALTLGVIANLGLYIPILGPLLTPVIFAIAATLYCAESDDHPIEIDKSIAEVTA